MACALKSPPAHQLALVVHRHLAGQDDQLAFGDFHRLAIAGAVEQAVGLEEAEALVLLRVRAGGAQSAKQHREDGVFHCNPRVTKDSIPKWRLKDAEPMSANQTGIEF